MPKEFRRYRCALCNAVVEIPERAEPRFIVEGAGGRACGSCRSTARKYTDARYHSEVERRAAKAGVRQTAGAVASRVAIEVVERRLRFAPGSLVTKQ